MSTIGRRPFVGAADGVARAQAAADEPVVETSLGKVRGTRVAGAYAFRGIRYAASTGGANRFRPPQPAQPWAGVQDALAFANQAPQRNPQPPTGPAAVILPRLLPPPSPTAFAVPEGEDCLFLNVWTAGLGTSRHRPVMVWLHGGFFYSGSGAGIDGASLAAHDEAVVVSVNHRLNVFGYTHLEDVGGEAFRYSGNAGMLDILAALAWVQQNIDRFGGDPKRVMVFGASGGGMKTAFVMASPRGRGLIHRAGVQSGPALRLIERDRASIVAEHLLHELGLERAAAGRLRELPVEQLLAAYYRLHWKDPSAEFRQLSVFGPVVDGDVLPTHPFDPQAAAPAARIPLLIGWNRDEMTFFMGADPGGFELDEVALEARLRALFGTGADRVLAAYRTAFPQATPSQLYIRAFSDYSIAGGVILQAERQAAAGAPVYLYRFDRGTPVLGGKLGSMHTLEAHYVFDNTEAQKAITGGGAEAASLARKMSRAWVEFAASGDPNASGAGLPHWPAFDAGRRATMIFNDESYVANDPTREERLALLATTRFSGG